jgi:peptidyl-prolyl isomerase F (cyclophilin D)
MPAAIVQLPPTNNPRFFFDIAMDGKRLGRAIIEVQASLAPKMAQNFHLLASHEKGFGYRGCHFFQAWRNESVICGDWEHNSGRGGRAALDEGPLFTPDETKLPCIRGAVGMRRMSKKHSSLNQVASQFRVILANMNTQFTGIFGHIVSGIEALDKVADIGGEGGRPEKIALVTNCGVYKG